MLEVARSQQVGVAEDIGQLCLVTANGKTTKIGSVEQPIRKSKSAALAFAFLSVIPSGNLLLPQF
jgi:hypothetical protein